MGHLLPTEITQPRDIFNQVLGPENETVMFAKGYWVSAIEKYVEKHGLDHFQESMEFIKENTKRNTEEHRIRPFKKNSPDKTLAEMERWSLDQNVHIRRLSSEGLCPRQSWS